MNDGLDRNAMLKAQARQNGRGLRVLLHARSCFAYIEENLLEPAILVVRGGRVVDAPIVHEVER